MDPIRRARDWMFGSRKPNATWWQVILWWEIRRIPYNVVVGVWGLVCLAIFYVAIQASGELKPGEDAEEPIVLIAAPFLVNACYTLGWLVELTLRRLFPALRDESTGPKLMKVGFVFSLAVVTLPAAIWTAIWAVRAVHPSR